MTNQNLSNDMLLSLKIHILFDYKVIQRLNTILSVQNLALIH